MERINLFNLRAQTHPPVADYINEVRQWTDLPPQSKFLRQGSGKHELHKPFLFKRKCWFLSSAYIPGELRSLAYLAGRYYGRSVTKFDLHPQCHFQTFTHGRYLAYFKAWLHGDRFIVLSFFRFTISFFASPIKCYRNGLIVFHARKHEKAKRKNEKPVPCSQAISVNPKLYEDGIDADVPKARIFAVGITNFSHSRQTMVLNNVTISSDLENIIRSKAQK